MESAAILKVPLIAEGASSYCGIKADISGRYNSYNYVYGRYNVLHYDKFNVSGRTAQLLYMYEKQIPDDVLIQLGLKYQPAFDVIKDLKDKFRSRIRVAPRIEILPVAAVAAVNYPAKSRKPVKFIDKRAHHV